VATLIQNATGLEAELVKGARGEFTIWVDEVKVAQKTSDGFPSEPEALAAVQKELARG
jgi:hypothetical protein